MFFMAKILLTQPLKRQKFDYPTSNITKLEVTNARKLLPHGQNFGLGCSKSGYNPWIIQN
jgi:hypothetical protein